MELACAVFAVMLAPHDSEQALRGDGISVAAIACSVVSPPAVESRPGPRTTSTRPPTPAPRPRPDDDGGAAQQPPDLSQVGDPNTTPPPPLPPPPHPADAAARPRIPPATSTPRAPRSSTRAASVVRLTGRELVRLRDPNYAPHGLWTRGYEGMMDQMKQLGFNTIRLPFSQRALRRRQHAQRHRLRQEPRPRGLTGLQIMDKIVAYAGADRAADHPRPPSPRRRRRSRSSGTRAATPKRAGSPTGRCWRRATPATRR